MPNYFYLLHLLFLIPVISLVYSATRYDDWPTIFHEAWRWGLRMATFLLIIEGAILALAILPF
jgi:lipopolysaccharide/colanic/teichoic acid biosynthesis glycosyltransferase